VTQPYRVVAWSTGNVGVHVIAGVDARPDLELVGVWVSNPDKVGKDAGDLAGLGRSLGVTATNDAEALLALEPDVIVHGALSDTRPLEAIEDLQRLLRAGVNIVSTGPVFLQYPYGVVDDSMITPIEAAALAGGVSLFVNGIDPGFANDTLPLLLTGVCERIDRLQVSEVLNYSTYNQPMVIFDAMGFGRPVDELPMMLQPGVLTMAWGSTVRQLAAGLDVALDSITEWHDRRPALETFEIACGTIEKGTTAALRFEIRGMRKGEPVIVVEHVTRLHDDLAPDWPQPAGQGGYRVQITGEPNYILELQVLGTDGDHNSGALKATAMRLVNAIPAVVAGPPGLLTALDLPLITGRGLFR
jgi:hypothetical protein